MQCLGSLGASVEKLIKLSTELYLTGTELKELQALNNGEDIYHYFIKISPELNKRCGESHPPKYYMFIYGYSANHSWWNGR